MITCPEHDIKLLLPNCNFLMTERITITVTSSGSYDYYEESVMLDGKKIGFIYCDLETVQPSLYSIARGYRPTLRSRGDYYFTALRHPGEPDEHFNSGKFCGYAVTLAGAHNLAQAYANYLIKRGF